MGNFVNRIKFFLQRGNKKKVKQLKAEQAARREEEAREAACKGNRESKGHEERKAKPTPPPAAPRPKPPVKERTKAPDTIPAIPTPAQQNVALLGGKDEVLALYGKSGSTLRTRQRALR